MNEAPTPRPSGEPADLLGEAAHAITALLSLIRRNAPELSGKTLGYAEAVAAKIATAQAAPAPQPSAQAAWIADVLRDVAELPDRDSPEDWPDAMLVTADELRRILTERAAPQAAPAPQAATASVAGLAEYTPGSWYQAATVDDMRRFYLSRLPAIREAAQAHGYAIGLHGSERRDFDLIAVPWRDGAADADTLAHAIAQAACGIDRAGAYEWEAKPAGRIATSLPICWTAWHDMIGAGHIDLSVVGAAPQAAPAPQADPVAALPERDTKLTDRAQGLFRKFTVTRTDGSSEPGGKHHGCSYFVLDVDHDPCAKAALTTYADAVEATHPFLAADMRDRYGLATTQAAPAPQAVLPDPHGCRACTHPTCGRFDGPRSVECTAMADGACARHTTAQAAVQPTGTPGTPSGPKICVERSAQACGPVYCGDGDAYCSACPRRAAIPVPLPACNGMNCGATEGRSHSLECHAEHAAAIAGGSFVPGAQAAVQPLTDEQAQAMWVGATIERTDMRSVYLRGLRDGERAHGITATTAKGQQ